MVFEMLNFSTKVFPGERLWLISVVLGKFNLSISPAAPVLQNSAK